MSCGTEGEKTRAGLKKQINLGEISLITIISWLIGTALILTCIYVAFRASR